MWCKQQTSMKMRKSFNIVSVLSAVLICFAVSCGREDLRPERHEDEDGGEEEDKNGDSYDSFDFHFSP